MAILCRAWVTRAIKSLVLNNPKLANESVFFNPESEESHHDSSRNRGVETPAAAETIPLSLQYLFAMFSATVLMPILFNIHLGIVLLFKGIGILLYLFICKGKIPAYLESSVTFISPVLLLPLGY